jgi:hypothetical protein
MTMTVEEKLTEEVRVLTEMVRALSQRISELEAQLGLDERWK